jgi:signal transduction histidine kinase
VEEAQPVTRRTGSLDDHPRPLGFAESRGHDGGRAAARVGVCAFKARGRAGTFVQRIYRGAQEGCRRTRRAAQRLELVLLPPARGSEEPTNEDYRRIVLFLATPAIAFFLPSLPLAGVPQSLWLPFAAITVFAAGWISSTFLLIPRTAGLLACLAAGSNALVVAGLGLAFRGYYHEIALLYVLLVAGHAVVHGLTAALVAVVLGPLIVPFVLQDPAAANWTDPFYTALYLTGTALIGWVGWRLAQRRAGLLGSLRRSSEAERSRLSVILGSMGDAVAAVDQDGAIVMTNRAYEGRFAALAAVADPDDDRGRPLPAARWPLARAARGNSFRMTFTLKPGAGERRWFEATGEPIGSGEDVAGGVVVIRDITDRSMRKLQEGFMATASHELRTPIAALHGYVQLLERHIDPVTSATAAGYARNALLQTRRVGHLLDRLFDLARLQTGALDVDVEPVDLVPIVRRAVEAARATGTAQTVDLQVEAESLEVLGDPGRLEEVLLNLLSNAATHAPDSNRVETRVAQDGQSATVEIRDYGPGIPADELARLFSRFRRMPRREGQGRKGQRTGLGLGLYLSQELMHAQGGTVDLASVVGEGTTATVRLPLRSAAQASGSRQRKLRSAKRAVKTSVH